jgi:hypothetical protein
MKILCYKCKNLTLRTTQYTIKIQVLCAILLLMWGKLSGELFSHKIEGRQEIKVWNKVRLKLASLGKIQCHHHLRKLWLQQCSKRLRFLCLTVFLQHLTNKIKPPKLKIKDDHLRQTQKTWLVEILNSLLVQPNIVLKVTIMPLFADKLENLTLYTEVKAIIPVSILTFQTTLCKFQVFYLGLSHTLMAKK